MTPIRKGTEIYLIAGYDRKATVSVGRLTVESFGKKQGTATRADNGRFIQCRIYPDQIGVSIFPVADVPDVQAFALQMAREYKAENITHYRNRAHSYWQDACHGYHEHMRRDCQAVMDAEPTVIFR